MRIHVPDGNKSVILVLRVTPRSSKNEITEVMGDGTVKIRITAPPVQGKANETLLKFLAGILDVPTSHLEIASGAGGRTKFVSVRGMNAATLHGRIAANINLKSKK